MITAAAVKPAARTARGDTVQPRRRACTRSGAAVASASSLEKEMRTSLKTGADIGAAKAVGKRVAERAAAAGVKDVVFDRGNYLYHGRVKALADAAREGGLKF